MSRRKSRPLDAEDHILWSQVIRTVTPLERRAPEPGLMPDNAATPLKAIAPPKPAKRPRIPLPVPQQQPAVARLPARSNAIDTKTRGRIAKGRLTIDARIDLHGQTQSQAHGHLLAFLRRAHADCLRHVLVITGKGSAPGSEGVLRRAVPSWFATAPFNGLVSGHAAASRQHGGEGALYVRLRRNSGN